MNLFKSKNKDNTKLTAKNIFYNNTFVLIFSLICSIIIWFYMAANNSLDRPKIIYDIPVTIELSDTAKAEGVRVFSQSTDNAKVSISGNSVIVNMINDESLTVVANLAPLAQKLSGNTMLTETLPLVAKKNQNDYADYEIDGVLPEEITVTYDRYKESVFAITNNLKYSTSQEYYVETPELSQTDVVISGPESSINKISKVVIETEISELVSSSTEFSSPIVLYDENNKKLNPKELFLTLETNEIGVLLNVLSKQTVTLDVTTLNFPEGFADNRISINPETIDIAGNYDIVSLYKTLVLSTAIDFNSVNLKNCSYEMSIPMPESTTNISKINTATVDINLNGFDETTVLTNNINLINIPDDKEVTLVEKNILVDVVGPSAQITSLSNDSIYCTVDMATFTNKNGNLEVPLTVGISGSTSTWVYGQHNILVNISDKAVSSTTEN